MEKNRKYEILIWILFSVLVGFIGYSSITEIKTPIEEYPQNKGKVINIGLCEYQTTAIVKGPLKINSKILCLTLDNKVEYKIFKTNRNYDSIIKNINVSDTIEIIFKKKIDSEDNRYTIIEIKKNNVILYSQEQWGNQVKIEIISFFLASFIFLIIGIIRHREYLKKISS